MIKNTVMIDLCMFGRCKSERKNGPTYLVRSLALRNKTNYYMSSAFPKGTLAEPHHRMTWVNDAPAIGSTFR